MVRALTLEDYIKKAKEIHNNKYDYTETKYINMKTKIKIKCNKCEVISETFPLAHFKIEKCNNCHLLEYKEKFIEKSRKIHGDIYDYTNSEIIPGANQKITFLCKLCNTVSTQFVPSHLQSKGCRNCWIKRSRLSQEDFINKAKEIHGDNFNYNLVEYITLDIKVKIKCNTCNIIFEQTPGGHIHHAHKCLNCTHNNQRKPLEEFIKQAKEIHGNKYNYDQVEYFNAYTKVKIYCNTCKNIFEQNSVNHIGNNRGCSICNFSKGESKCKIILDNFYDVKNYIPQFSFKDCKNVNVLPFDFKVTLRNSKYFLIEYQGEQHYKQIKFFSTRTLEEQQQIDKIKYDYCKNNNINLLIIKYTDFDNIEEIIYDFIEELL